MIAPQLIEQLMDDWSTATSPLWDSAHCRDETGAAADLFFSDQIPDINRAKAICIGCPVQAPCLEGALEREEPWGVWGGHLFANGAILAQKRKRGRPPKQRHLEEGVQMTA